MAEKPDIAGFHSPQQITRLPPLIPIKGKQSTKLSVSNLPRDPQLETKPELTDLQGGTLNSIVSER